MRGHAEPLLGRERRERLSQLRACGGVALIRAAASNSDVMPHKNEQSGKMVVRVFIQNEAGSNQKNYHNEKTFEFKAARTLPCAYPYPYGFVVGTNADDGCNVDCFVITERKLRTGQIIECEAIALMEQIEDDKPDHNVLATLLDENIQITRETQTILTDFVLNVFRHVAGKQIHVGRFLGAKDARAHILASLDGS